MGYGFGWFVWGDRERFDFREVAEPGALAFGELTSAGLDAVDGLGQRGAVGEKVDDFGVADALHGNRADGAWVGEEAFDFGDEAGIKKFEDALVDAVVEVGAW